MNVVAGTLILVGAIIGRRRIRALGVAVAIFAITPALVPEEAGWIRPSHFVERHGLVVMVALGESVVAVGIGASGPRHHLAADGRGDPGAHPEHGALVGLLPGGPRRGGGCPARHDPDQARVLRGERRLLLGPPADPARDRRIAAALEHAIGHAFDPLSFARACWEAGPPSTSPGMRSSGAHSASPSSPGARSRWCSRSRRSPSVRRPRRWLSSLCWLPRWGPASRLRT